MKTTQVYESLRRFHDETFGEWVLLRECFNVDALALQVWAGRTPRWRRVAYEIKVSRADFRREIRRPQKRRRALELSDQFYFAAPAGLIQRSELPEECGLVEVGDDGVARVVRRAPVRPARDLHRHEVAYLVRRRSNPYRLQRVMQVNLRLEAQLHQRELQIERLYAQIDGLRLARLAEAV